MRSARHAFAVKLSKSGPTHAANRSDSEAPGGGANGLFNGGGIASLQAQVVGVLAVGAFTMVVSLVAWFLIKATMGMRVTPEDESRGLDISEMGMEAYAGDPLA